MRYYLAERLLRDINNGGVKGRKLRVAYEALVVEIQEKEDILLVKTAEFHEAEIVIDNHLVGKPGISEDKNYYSLVYNSEKEEVKVLVL